jgi:hypothetical protein
VETQKVAADFQNELHVADIVVGERHRRDVGDIATLAANMDELGLLVTAAAARKARRAAAKRHGKLRRAEASQYLWEVHGVRYAPASMAKYATRGVGPIFRYLDDWIPVYAPKNLDRWLKPSIGKPRRQTRKRARDKAAAHQPTGHNGGTEQRRMSSEQSDLPLEPAPQARGHAINSNQNGGADDT